MHEIECGEIAKMDDDESIYQALYNILVQKKIYSFEGIEKYSWEYITKKYIKHNLNSLTFIQNYNN